MQRLFWIEPGTPATIGPSQLVPASFSSNMAEEARSTNAMQFPAAPATTMAAQLMSV